MFRKIIRGVAVFVFFTGLVFYVLIWFLFDFLIDIFIGTKITKLIFLIRKELERCTENITVKIIKQLEKMDLWP